jgi:uncharacterized protein YciI
MHYILFYEVVDGFAEKRLPYREDHLKRVGAARKRGDLILAGALAEPADQAVLVFNGPQRQPAEEFATNDPYVTSGLVKNWTVRKWMTVSGEAS